MKHIIGAALEAEAPAAKLLPVDEDTAGQRLDNFLIRHLKGVPKTHVYRIIRSGEVRVNKGRAQADTRVQAGDMVRVPPVRVSERVAEKAAAMAHQVAQANSQGMGHETARSMVHMRSGGTSVKVTKAFPVLFEDEHVLAIDKPAGVAVHGGSGVSFGVIEQLRMARPQARFLELVHRLDRETSGILLVAKKRSALNHLQDQFRDRETGKTYLALALGTWPANKKVLDKPLHKYLVPSGEGEGERRVKVVARDDPNGMKSITLVKISRLIAKPEPFTLLEVTIKTGRTHQIRVHLASEGHPIAGDDKYGDFERNRALQRQDLKRMFLHAWRLQFVHPQTGESMTLHAQLPPELASFVAPVDNAPTP